MKFQFTNPYWLALLPLALAWVFWLARSSHVQISPWRRAMSLILRTIIVTLLVLAIAGLQSLLPQDGMNVYFAIDRSDSVPSQQQEFARNFVNRTAAKKEKDDRAGVIVFGGNASIEMTPNPVIDMQKFQAVITSERTDIAGAVRLGSAAFPETGQKRLVILSDFNENMGDAMAAVVAGLPLGVTVDVVPLGSQRGSDVSIQRLVLPNNLKKGTTFETKIFVNADRPQNATLRLFRNEQYLGEQQVELSAGKNLFTFPQTLTDQGFYSYRAELEAGGDVVPQNNRAASFTSVKGDPRVLIVSAQPEQDRNLAEALLTSKLEVRLTGVEAFPGTLAELQSYDAIFLSNVAAGDLGLEMLRLLESAVRDFGVGVVCIGGDQSFAAGGYRGTPLETMLPVNMELDSKKVLPKGALVLVMHGMEFMNGNQVAREIGLGALDALGPQDELGVILWDGTERWLFELTPVGDRRDLARKIAGMNQGDLPSFQGVMTKGYEGLKKSTANLKHMIVFSDGDPGAPSAALMQSMVQDRITVSTVLIAGHAGPDTMISIADQGKGRFYDVRNPSQLPQIFIKEAAVILKSAIYEEPFRPQQVASSELIRGISAAEYPALRGYVASTAKPRAETPLLTDKTDPLLAHWQYGLGRAVAFTSDAKPRWAADWLSWEKYRQFWSQIAQWSLRRLDNADFTTEVSVDKGQGIVSVEALDEQGNYRNFLSLQTTVVSPNGQRQTVRLEQTGPGHYEGRFDTKEIGSYLMNLMDMKDGQVRGSQVLGASVNYSPEFNNTGPDLNLAHRIAEAGSGRVLDPAKPDENPFNYNRKRTFQPKDLWELLMQIAIILFPLDVGIRRIQLDREEWAKATASLRRAIFFWKGKPRTPEAEESLAALLSRRESVRSKQTAPGKEASPDLFKPANPIEVPKESVFYRPAAEPEKKPEKPAEPESTAEKKDEPPSVTSRLLEAKRRAQQPRKKD